MGDIRNALSTLQSWLRKLKYDGGLDVASAKAGAPEFYLPLIHYGILVCRAAAVCSPAYRSSWAQRCVFTSCGLLGTLKGYSREVARFVSARGHDLYGRSDLKFIEGVYRLLRDEFKYSPRLNKQQFFTVGFAGQKMLLCSDILRLCSEKHTALVKEARLASSSSRRVTSAASRSLRDHGQEAPASSVRNKATQSLSDPGEAAPQVHAQSHAESALRLKEGIDTIQRLEQRVTTGSSERTNRVAGSVVTDSAAKPDNFLGTGGDSVGAHVFEDYPAVQNFYAPKEVISEHQFGNSLDASADTSVGKWATHTLRESEGAGHSDIIGGAPAGPARTLQSTQPIDSSEPGVDEVVRSVERLSACVIALSDRVEMMQGPAHAASFGRGYAAEQPGRPHDIMAMVGAIEQRLALIQQSFEERTDSLSAQLMLTVQRVTALEASVTSEAPIHRETGDRVHRMPTNLHPSEDTGPLASLNASLARLEYTMGTENQYRHIYTPPRAGREDSFRPPSTSSPKRPLARTTQNSLLNSPLVSSPLSGYRC